MLANAADAGSSKEMRTAFVGMLSQMTRFDVTILATLVRASDTHPDAPYIITDQLPDAVRIGPHQDSSVEFRDDVEISLSKS